MFHFQVMAFKNSYRVAKLLFRVVFRAIIYFADHEIPSRHQPRRNALEHLFINYVFNIYLLIIINYVLTIINHLFIY